MSERSQKITPLLEEKLKKVRMLLLDVDGVLTDGGIYLGRDAREFKRFDVQDGLGIRMIRLGEIKVGIITGRQSESVSIRARELGVDACHQGVTDKLAAYRQIRDASDCTDEAVCYVGDDLSDLAVMEKAGVSIAVKNARWDVKQRADYITESTGGYGAVREVTDLILKVQERWETVMASL